MGKIISINYVAGDLKVVEESLQMLLLLVQLCLNLSIVLHNSLLKSLFNNQVFMFLPQFSNKQ